MRGCATSGSSKDPKIRAKTWLAACGGMGWLAVLSAGTGFLEFIDLEE
jgi:hypothetical protein